MAFYNLALEEIFKRLKTDPNKGLPINESVLRLEHDGPNVLPKHKPNFWKVYFAPLFNWLIVIYLIGAVILLIAGSITEEGTSNTLLYTTLAVVALNCGIAIIQQYRATKKLKALEELSAPTAKVKRDGEFIIIPSKQIVVGDIIRLEQGDRIPSDSRIIDSSNLEVDESSLTGESESIRKENTVISGGSLPVQSQTNLIFLGTYVTQGNATAVVIRTGMYTEIGTISRGLKSVNMREIPIQKKMNNFGKWLGLSVLGFWLITFVIIWITTGKANIFKSLNSAMDIMPINIPLLSTIVMITGVLTMARRGVIIRNLTSVDSLGRISVLCADKTGTITEGKMMSRYVLTHLSEFKITGEGYSPSGTFLQILDDNSSNEITNLESNPDLKRLLISSKLSSNAILTKKIQQVQKNNIEIWGIIGSPTEGALITLYEKSTSLFNENEVGEYNFLTEYPFDSCLKMMSKFYKIGLEFILFAKGATENIIEKSISILIGDKIQKFTDTMKKSWEKRIKKYSENGHRAISFGLRKFDHEPSSTKRSDMESDLIYLGAVMILDLPRDYVEESVQLARDAGIEVKMITGDSLLTANSIARKIGLQKKNYSGIDLSQDTLDDVSQTSVFARVSPSDKHEIVTRLQDQSHIVAMTGDGVNDALSLSKADVGIAMGIRGTDVAKEAADMIIANDSFNSIVKGIAEGRGIFARIRAVVFFYIAINVFEGLVQFVLSIIFDLPYFLDTEFYLQWIFLSITLHSIPGLILTFDITNNDVMKEKPRDSEEILTKKILILMVSYGLLLAISMCIVYFLCISGTYPLTPFNIGSDNFPYFGDTTSLQIQGKTLTMLMLTLFFCESILIFQIRRMNKPLLKSIKEDSKWWMFLLIGILFSIFIALMYIPGFQNWLTGIQIGDISFNFRFMRLTIWDWMLCVGIASICIIGFEVVKYIFRKKGITF